MMGVESRPKPKVSVPLEVLRAGAERLQHLHTHDGYECTRIWGRAGAGAAVPGWGRFDPESDGPAGNLWAGDPVDVAREVLEAALPVLEEGAAAELAQALVHTVEYVGLDTLQPVEGWSWYDALENDTLPDEDVASDYDEVEKAIANT